MGRQDAPAVSAEEELAVFDAEQAPEPRRLPMTPNSREYFEGKAGVLDHVVASTRMEEVAATAHVIGYCALARCTDPLKTTTVGFAAPDGKPCRRAARWSIRRGKSIADIRDKWDYQA